METLVNGKNYFNEKSLAEMYEKLEQGLTISVYIDCIGHTRNNNEQENYKNALLKKYGDRLVVNLVKGNCSYHYNYKLTNVSNLKRKREALNMSQSQLAERSGVSYRTLQEYEQGRKDINKAQGLTLYKIALALNTSVEDLLEI